MLGNALQDSKLRIPSFTFLYSHILTLQFVVEGEEDESNDSGSDKTVESEKISGEIFSSFYLSSLFAKTEILFSSKTFKNDPEKLVSDLTNALLSELLLLEVCTIFKSTFSKSSI